MLRDAEHNRSSVAVSPSFAFLPQAGKCLFAVDGLHPSALDVVIAAVENFPRAGEIVNIPGQRVL